MVGCGLAEVSSRNVLAGGPVRLPAVLRGGSPYRPDAPASIWKCRTSGEAKLIATLSFSAQSTGSLVLVISTARPSRVGGMGRRGKTEEAEGDEPGKE